MELSEWHLWFKRRGGRELRDLVMREWDPIGVSDAPEARDEYDGYLGRIAERLRREASAEEIAELLGSFRTADMGLRSDSVRDRRVAEILVAWYASAIAEYGRADTVHDDELRSDDPVHHRLHRGVDSDRRRMQTE